MKRWNNLKSDSENWELKGEILSVTFLSIFFSVCLWTKNFFFFLIFLLCVSIFNKDSFLQQVIINLASKKKNHLSVKKCYAKIRDLK